MNVLIYLELKALVVAVELKKNEEKKTKLIARYDLLINIQYVLCHQ